MTQDLNDAIIYAQLANSAYYNNISLGSDQTINNITYNYIVATADTTLNGFQAVIYGRADTYDETTGKYGEIVVSYSK